jgi:hypothetical protein
MVRRVLALTLGGVPLSARRHRTKFPKLAFIAATLALGVAPALAKPATPGPSASLAAKATTYGKACQGESKTHVAGTPGTPFSKCVTDMARLANGSAQDPRAACKDESKKHVAGHPGTPFSLCVSGAAKLLKSEHVHLHNPGPRADRCTIDARRVDALEERIGSAANTETELARLEDQLVRAIERAQQDCGS